MSELSEFREAKDEFLAKNYHSPLTPLQRHCFHGLDYYPENSDLRLVVRIDEFPDHNKHVTEMATTTGDSQGHVAWGSSSFVVDGEEVSLTVYQDTEADEFSYPSPTQRPERRHTVEAATWMCCH